MQKDGTATSSQTPTSSMPSMHTESMPTVVVEDQSNPSLDRKLSSESGLCKASMGSLATPGQEYENSTAVPHGSKSLEEGRPHTPVARSVSNTSAWSEQSTHARSRGSVRRASSLECLESEYKVQQRNSAAQAGMSAL